jgi:hypothetical protein
VTAGADASRLLALFAAGANQSVISAICAGLHQSVWPASLIRHQA